MKSITSDEELYKLAKKIGILLNTIVSRDQIKLGPYENYIINMAPHDKDGTHWIALWIKDGSAVYFDSFGQVPPLDVEEFIHSNGIDKYLMNSTQIQDMRSGYCGEYCLDFLKHMSGFGTPSKKMSMFLSRFRSL